MFQNKENVTEVGLPVAQRSSEWFSKRIGKITSSKAPTVIVLQGKREFQQTWDCIGNRKAEPSKNFRNFHRGMVFKDEAAKYFASESAAAVKKCGLFSWKMTNFMELPQTEHFWVKDTRHLKLKNKLGFLDCVC